MHTLKSHSSFTLVRLLALGAYAWISVDFILLRFW